MVAFPDLFSDRIKALALWEITAGKNGSKFMGLGNCQGHIRKLIHVLLTSLFSRD
jgi:hypothetical protein